MASHQSPLPSPLFSAASPPWPTPPPSERSLVCVLVLFWFSSLLFILYSCCYPLLRSTFRRRNSLLNRLRDLETGLPPSFAAAQRRAVLVVIERDLKTFEFSAEESAGKTSDCCVCMEAFTAGDSCKLLRGCGHSFHEQCINPWLKIKPHCPVCRFPVLCVWTSEISDSGESTPASESPRRSPA